MTSADPSAGMSWHYGLVARWWAEFNTGGPEIAYYSEVVATGGGPALDLGCGAGRLLVPMLQAGLDVDGVDVSGDMLAHARAAAASAGFAPGLYEQPMHKLATPRRYRTVICCGSIGLGGGLRLVEETLRRVHAHLQPGGLFAGDWGGPAMATADVARGLEAHGARLPEPWPESGLRQRCADGDEIELRMRTSGVDVAERVARREMRATLLRDGTAVAEEEHALSTWLVSREEILGAMERAGFKEVAITDAYKDGIGAPGPVAVVRGRRRGQDEPKVSHRATRGARTGG